MATIGQVVNKINCGVGGGSTRGTGTAFCDVDIKSLTTLGFTKKNKSISSTTVLTQSVFTDMVQREEMTIVKGIVGTSFTTAGNEYQTYETGIKKLTNKNPYEIEVTLNRGIHNYKAVASLESNTLYDVWLFDEKNDCFMALNSDGSIRGLDGLIVTIEDYKGGKENSYMLRFQISRNDFDNNVSVIKSENLGFDAKRILDGYNDIDIVVTTPSAGATFNFQTWATTNNKRFGLFGLLSSEIKVEKATFNAGVVTGWTNAPFTMLPSSLGSDPDYIVTLSTAMATGDIYRIKTFDSTIQSNVIYVEGTFYKSHNPTKDNYFEFTVL